MSPVTRADPRASHPAAGRGQSPSGILNGGANRDRADTPVYRAAS
ncbi:hypothetical protein [Nocardiopsis sp. SBT366]|nr:hypothetical protein [Nocardiopsis sp. SBT366]